MNHRRTEPVSRASRIRAALRGWTRRPKHAATIVDPPTCLMPVVTDEWLTADEWATQHARTAEVRS